MLAWGLAQLVGSLVLLWQPVLPHPGIFFLSLPFVLASLVAGRARWLAAFWLGAALAAWQAHIGFENRLPPSLDGEIVTLTGRISGLVERDVRRQRFLFEVEHGRDATGKALALPRKVRLSLYEFQDVETGERWQWRAKLRRPRGFANPGGFDYERWLFAHRIGATGYVYHPSRDARRLGDAGGGWRAGIAARVAQQVDGPAAGIVRGLATGDQSGIPPAQWTLLRQTGTAHLVSISGLHIGLVTALGFAVAAFIRRRLKPSSALWPPALAGLALALAYGALAAFNLPVMRAVTAAGIVSLALAWRRTISPGHAFGTVLAVVLCVDPLAPLNVGFWLSFVAVAAILFLLAGRRPAGSRLRRALHVQAGLFALLAPLIALCFGRLPLVSPLANIVAIPVFDLLAVPCILLALPLLHWDAAARALLAVPAWMLEHLLEFLGWLAALDPKLASVALPVPVQVFAVAGVLLACTPRAWRGRSIASWLLLPALFVNLFPAARAPLTVHFLDVGQGLSVVLETPSHTMVYDTGPGFGANDAAAMVVIPFLESRGRNPDVLMISHGHDDHAGGLETLAARYPSLRMLGRAEDERVADCADRAWRWDGVSFEVLHPPPRAGAAGNDESCVLRVSRGNFSLLLTGDIEALAEARLVARQRARLSADVVLVPHHGSRTSSTPSFIEATRPDLAIAAAGHGNRWGFPKPDVVQRWKDSGALVLNTGAQGAISLVIDEEGYCVRSYREQRRLWRDPAAVTGTPCRREHRGEPMDVRDPAHVR